MRRWSPLGLARLLFVLLPLALLCGLLAGPQWILPTADFSFSASDQLILEQLRAPRVLLAAIIGATLAVAGAVMQGLFRNPLADPSLIGVSAGASAGASCMIVIAAPWLGAQELLGISLVGLGAFAGAALTTWLVYRLAAGASGTSVSTMLLAGIAISALAGAINSFFSFIADHQMLRQISLWQMGSLAGVNWPRLIFAAILLLPLLAAFQRFCVPLNALLLGESEARHLGVRVDRLRLEIIVLVALAVGVAVSLTGTIAFVGLVTPHIVRLLIGPDHRFLLPCSMLGGALLLVLADAAARTVLAPGELPIGVVTALLGAPFFLSLLRQHRQGL